MKKFAILSAIAGFALMLGCGSSSSSGDSSGNAYSTFGQTFDSVVPSGLKSGGANANIAAMMTKDFPSLCDADYNNCPYITATGGGDSASGEILMRIWGIDYSSECTSSLITAGTCFNCVDCSTGIVGNNFIKPTMLATPTSCAATSTTAGHYVNMGVDPCFFDNMIGQISNIDECKTVEGGSVDISTAVPWYASWGIPQTIKFSSYYAKSSGGIWWTVNNSGTVGNQQYFFSLDSDWLYVGIKNVDADNFIFLGTGSPAYYSGRGEGSGVNISAYAGPVSGIPAQFEAMQVRVQDQKYIIRVKSNGTHLWFQKWEEAVFPATPATVDTYKNSPSIYRCMQIGSSVVTSKYVPLTECYSSFGKADLATMNADSNFTLKVIDQQTASAISFSTALTPTTTTSCLNSEAGQ